MTVPIVRILDVVKEYRADGQAVRALDGVSLDVQAGEFVALVGRSGCGKTTLLNLAGAMDAPTSGDVVIDGASTQKLDDAGLTFLRREKVGFIFQSFQLLPTLSVVENVELPLLLAPLSKSERRQRAMTALRIVGLEDRSKHYPRQLSGGQEQRVAIARAVVTDPTVLVADEPTGDLDHQSAEEILTLMETFNKEFGKTIVMVTHDPRAAARANVQHHLDKGVFSA